MSSTKGPVHVHAVSRTSAELLAPVPSFYLTNPENYQFYLDTDPSQRFYIGAGNTFVQLPTFSATQVAAGVSAAIDGISLASRSTALSPSVPYAGVKLSKYARSRAAWAGVKAKTQHMKLVLLGDSTTVGAYSTGTYPNPVQNGRPMSPTPWFAAALQSYDVPVVDAGFCGDQNVSAALLQDGTTVATLADYDLGRTATLPAGWSSLAASNVLTLGGNMVNGSGANSFQFRPFEPTDTADLYTRTDAGLATNWTFSRAVTNEIVSGLTSAGSPALTKTTLVCASPTINFWKAQRISGGGNLFIAMMDCYDSTKKSVRVFNAGWSSSRCSDWKVTTSPWSPLNALIALNPDLVVIQPGINEYNNAGDQTGSPSSTVGGQFPATFQADLEIIVTALIAAGIDVILRTHYPSQNSSKTLVMQKAYRDVTIAVAANHSLIVDDVWGKLTTWEQANGKGWMADSLHPVGEGYRRSAESLAALVQGVMMA